MGKSFHEDTQSTVWSVNGLVFSENYADAIQVVGFILKSYDLIIKRPALLDTIAKIVASVRFMRTSTKANYRKG